MVVAQVCRGACPPKDGVIALWPDTRVVKCKNYVSQKQNRFNNKIHWYSILLTFISKFMARLLWTKIRVHSNLNNCQFTTWQYQKSGPVRGRPECDYSILGVAQFELPISGEWVQPVPWKMRL